ISVVISRPQRSIRLSQSHPAIMHWYRSPARILVSILIICPWEKKTGLQLCGVHALERSQLNRIIDASQDEGWPKEKVNMARLDSFCRDNNIERINLLKTD